MSLLQLHLSIYYLCPIGSHACVLFQKHRPRLEQDRAVGIEENLKEGDMGMGTTARLDICTGTAICSGLKNEWNTKPQQDTQGTADLPLCRNLLLQDELSNSSISFI